jgi:hypothetical protein
MKERKPKQLPQPVEECLVIASDRDDPTETFFVLNQGHFITGEPDYEKVVQLCVQFGVAEKKARMLVSLAGSFRCSYYHFPTGEMRGDWWDVMRHFPEDIIETLIGGWENQKERNREYARYRAPGPQFQEPTPGNRMQSW